jgi:tetratricopeptide (TPR) repeat protein
MRALSEETLAALLRGERSLLLCATAAVQREARSVLERDPQCAEAHHLLGEALRLAGDLSGAEAALKQAIALEPGVGTFHHALGSTLQDAGRSPEAIDAYARSLRLAPGAAEVWNDLGTACFRAGEPDRAADCYRNALRRAPGHVVALSNLGATLRRQGDVRGALQAYRRELTQRVLQKLRAPSAENGLAEQARRHAVRGSHRMAEALADKALREHPADARAVWAKAKALEAAGHLAAAAQVLQNDARLRADYAKLLRRAGDALTAVDVLRSAGNDSSVRRELAYCLAKLGRQSEALELLQQGSGLSGDADTLTAIAALELDEARAAPAFEALERALKLDPYHAPAVAQLTRLRVMQEKAGDAVVLGRISVQRDPTCAAAQYWCGRALALSWHWEEACAAFREAMELDDPEISASAALWLSNALRVLERPREAEVVLLGARERWPGDAELAVRHAVLAGELGELGRARAELADVLAREPTHPGALAAICAVASAEGNMDEALRHARSAVDLDGKEVVAHHNLGLTLLKLGQFQEGWAHYEWRRKLETHAGSYLRFAYPEWSGEPLEGKSLLTYAEQGLGDEIMFASCIPQVRARAAHVVIECDPRLAALFQRSFPGCAVFGRARTTANNWVKSLDPQPDWQIAMGSLPRLLRSRPEDFPPHPGYLRADPAKVSKWRERLAVLGPGRKIGLSWRGGLMKTGRLRRSLDLPALRNVLRIPGMQFVSLQYGNVEEELAGLTHWQEAIDDYDETAALVTALDGVVSVCTALVHLTGALGVRALVMAPFSPEWRYGISGHRMPWYPSVRILRQSRPGDWDAVLAALVDHLQNGWAG